MAVEGLSMINVFSLLTVSIAISMSILISSRYVAPAVDIDTVLGGVAYDLSSLYEIAYTLPGEITVHYYGPSICEWNYNLPSDSAESFNCVGGKAVLIKDVRVKNDLIYVMNDSYMNYDANTYPQKRLNAEALEYTYPTFSSISIRYYNAKVCGLDDNGNVLYCSEAYSPFAASYTDYDMIATKSPFDVEVKDYSFVIKKRDNGYFFTIAPTPSNPYSLSDFISAIATRYNLVCSASSDTLEAGCYNGRGEKVDCQKLNSDGAPFNDDGNTYYYMIPKGYRWRVEGSELCQDRIYLNSSGWGYTTDYCFDLLSFVNINRCSNVDKVLIADNFKNEINENYVFFASMPSCVKPFIVYDPTDRELIINATHIEYNPFTGECI